MRAFGAAKFWMDDPAPVETLRLRRAPLLAAAISFGCGELIARQWQFTVILLTALALLLVLSIVAMRKSPRIAPLPILALWAVAGCWCAQMQPWPAPQTALLQNADGLSRTVRGRVVRVRPLPATRSSGDPDRFEPGAWESEGTTPAESVDLDVQQVEY